MKAYNERIECIAAWSKRGEITPIRFKFKNRTYGHIKVLFKNINKHAGNPMHIFSCTATCQGQERNCELRFELNTCLWCLYKI